MDESDPTSSETSAPRNVRVPAINHPRRQDEGEPDQKIRGVPDKGGGRALDREFDQHLQYDDDRARNRSQRERADQRGNIRKIEFQKAGKRRRNGKPEHV